MRRPEDVTYGGTVRIYEGEEVIEQVSKNLTVTFPVNRLTERLHVTDTHFYRIRRGS